MRDGGADGASAQKRKKQAGKNRAMDDAMEQRNGKICTGCGCVFSFEYCEMLCNSLSVCYLLPCGAGKRRSKAERRYCRRSACGDISNHLGHPIRSRAIICLFDLHPNHEAADQKYVGIIMENRNGFTFESTPGDPGGPREPERDFASGLRYPFSCSP